MSNDVFVKIPIATFPCLEGHTSKFVFNLGALGVDSLFSKQLCVQGLVGSATILGTDKAFDVGNVGGVFDNTVKKFPNSGVVVFKVWMFGYSS